MTKRPEERFAAVIAIRLPEEVKRMLIGEATARKESLSAHVFNLIKTGWETMQTKAGEPASTEKLNEAEVRAAKTEVETKDLENVPRITPAEGEPQGQPGGPEPARLNEPKDGPVDEAFLTGVRERYPNVNYEKFMGRIDGYLKQTGKEKTRHLIERAFEIAQRKVMGEGPT